MYMYMGVCSQINIKTNTKEEYFNCSQTIAVVFFLTSQKIKKILFYIKILLLSKKKKKKVGPSYTRTFPINVVCVSCASKTDIRRVSVHNLIYFIY